MGQKPCGGRSGKCCGQEEERDPNSLDDPADDPQDEGGVVTAVFDGLGDTLDGAVGLLDFDHEPDSGSDIETMAPPKKFERMRSNAVCVEVFGSWNQRRPFTPPKFNKNPDQVSLIRASLLTCPLFEHLKDDEMTSVVDAIEIVTFKGGSSVFERGDQGDALFVVVSGGIDCVVNDAGSEGSRKVLKTLKKKDVFGEVAVLWGTPRALSAIAKEGGESVLARLGLDVYQNIVVHGQMLQREQRQHVLKGVKLLETLSDEHLVKLADAMEPRNYQEGDVVIHQGEPGAEFFIVESGECAATVTTGFFVEDVQEHRRYYSGDLFGELALLTGEPRGASVTALKDSRLLVLSRRKFERLFGPLTQLKAAAYLTDPRKLIADFYGPGDRRGCAGALKLDNLTPNKGEKTSWFAVYRPTSRDAIAKMLSGCAVGKGLNIKGKSAKKGMLSGFVPFLQISNNDHKDKIEKAPRDARLWIFFKNEDCRKQAREQCQRVLESAQPPLDIDSVDTNFRDIDAYVPDAYGIDMKEAIMNEAFIQRQDISPLPGWESGRASEPAFMDMNLHAVRDAKTPHVVLIQNDSVNAMNPRTLLVAYAEASVKPVVSDFDTFTIGSRMMAYNSLPDEQVKLAEWSLDRADEIMQVSDNKSWTSRWLEVLKVWGEKGFHPDLPFYGFGDPTSYGLIDRVVRATISCGAVRHGAECFNFYFPQELDPEYLIVWENFGDPPWAYTDEAGLRAFLLERIQEGFTFPINPVWPIRDPGWFEVLQALQKTNVTAMAPWFPPGSGLIEKIEALHKKHPKGFVIGAATAQTDLDSCEKHDLAHHELAIHAKIHRAKGKMHAAIALGHIGKPSQTTGAASSEKNAAAVAAGDATAPVAPAAGG